MKTLAILSALGVILGPMMPMLAEIAHVDPMPWSGQLGVSGASLAILLLVVVRVIPTMSKQNNESLERVSAVHRESIREFAKAHSEALGDVKDELSGLRDDLNTQQQANASMLREALMGQRGPK